MSVQNQLLASHCYFSNIIGVIGPEWSKEVPTYLDISPTWQFVELEYFTNFYLVTAFPFDHFT